MRLAAFNYRGIDRIGVPRGDDGLVDLAAALGGDSRIPGNMIDLIAMGEAGLELAALADKSGESAEVIPMEEVIWLPPVPRPGKICGIALNNAASNARKISAPDHPAFFLKPASCLIGHGAPIVVRPYYGSVHPEPELALIIGKTTRDVDAADAADHIYGYSIFNDITGNGMRAEDLFHYKAIYASESAPDELIQREQHLSYAGRYKGTDTFGVLGPFLVTKDDVPDPDNLGVSCRVSGEVVAEDSTRFYNFKVAEIVSFISQFHTLHPGDVISCGTAFKPSKNRKSIHHANFLKVGGPVEITIDLLGTQVNPVVVEEREIGQWRLT